MFGLCPWVTFFWFPPEPWFPWLLLKILSAVDPTIDNLPFFKRLWKRIHYSLIPLVRYVAAPIIKNHYIMFWYFGFIIEINSILLCDFVPDLNISFKTFFFSFRHVSLRGTFTYKDKGSIILNILSRPIHSCSFKS